MHCARCRKECGPYDLRPLSKILRVLSLTIFFEWMASEQVRGELNGIYCASCRQQMNVAISFLAFMVLVAVGMFAFGLLLTGLAS